MTRNETTAASEKTPTPAWYYKPDGKGAFDVFNHDETILKRHPDLAGKLVDGRVLTGVTEVEAKEHVRRAIKSEERRDRYMELARPHFKTNWKLETKRIVYPDRDGAERVAEALSYFLGGAEIKPVEGGFEVGSHGYYNYVGA